VSSRPALTALAAPFARAPVAHARTFALACSSARMFAMRSFPVLHFAAGPLCFPLAGAERDSQLASIAVKGRVDDEQLGGDVGVEVVAADERDDVAASESFDGRARIGF
jgi:hypothetical protein